MKKICLFLFAVMIAAAAYTQSLPNFAAIKLDRKEDFDAAANRAARQAAQYILSTPVNKNDADRQASIKYLIRWTIGSPEYNFDITEIMRMANKNDDLFGVGTAAMVKEALENKAAMKDMSQFTVAYVEVVIAYAKDPANGIKISGEIKKLIQADNKGTLEAYLSEHHGI